MLPACFRVTWISSGTGGHPYLVAMPGCSLPATACQRVRATTNSQGLYHTAGATWSPHAMRRFRPQVPTPTFTGAARHWMGYPRCRHRLRALANRTRRSGHTLGLEGPADNQAGDWMLPAPLPAFPERISIGWVQRVAADQNVHPIIVLGRLQRVPRPSLPSCTRGK